MAVGLYLTNDFNRDQYRLQQDSTRQQQDLALKGQRAERFVKAIDQLGQEGNDKLGIRLGGIYALETLMRESSNDQNTVIEVLCAFVRTHAPRPKSVPEIVPPASEDVRAAVSVLGRRPRLDPRSAPGAIDAPNLDFSNTLLGLRRIDLNDADLTAVFLVGADLVDANLVGADLRDADLRDAYLRDAGLRGADLRGADLSGADLSYAGLRGADLDNANLGGADLVDADLRGADLSGEVLGGANLLGADLRDADLSGAYLRDANLVGADLRGADLREANLDKAKLNCTAMDDQTKLPPGILRSDRRPECQ